MYKRVNVLDECERIAWKIDELRLMRGWTFEELGRRSGVGYSAINSWVNGYSVPKIQSLIEVCNALRVSVAELFRTSEGTQITQERLDLIDLTSQMSSEQVKELTNYLREILK